MTQKTLTIDNNSSFRETFNEILSNYNKTNIKLINGITFNSYDFLKNDNDVDIIYTTIKQIMKDTCYRKICLTFECDNKVLKIECSPYIGSA